MDTVTAIIVTQIPIAIAILIGAYELNQTRKELIKVLKKLSKKINSIRYKECIQEIHQILLLILIYLKIFHFLNRAV